MSNYNSLKSTIDANIKQNGNQEITGQILNSVLNQMVTTLGAGYQFAGVATLDPATDPGTPDAKVFYIANGKGTYTNFGGIEVTEDDVVVLYWDSSWHKVSTGIASNDKLTELGQKIDLINNKLGVSSEYSRLNGYVIYPNGLVNTLEGYSICYLPVKAGENVKIKISQSETRNLHYGFSQNVPSQGFYVTLYADSPLSGTSIEKTISVENDGYLCVNINHETFVSIGFFFSESIIKDSLSETTKGYALDATQGKVLNDKIDTTKEVLDGSLIIQNFLPIDSEVEGKVLTTGGVMDGDGKILKYNISNALNAKLLVSGTFNINTANVIVAWAFYKNGVRDSYFKPESTYNTYNNLEVSIPNGCDELWVTNLQSWGEPTIKAGKYGHLSEIQEQINEIETQIQDIPKNEKIYNVKKSGDIVGIACKYSATQDMCYIFTYCMANNLFTLWASGLLNNSGETPIAPIDPYVAFNNDFKHRSSLAIETDMIPITVQVQTQNHGEQSIGGNHTIDNGGNAIKTAQTESFTILVDGVEITAASFDMLCNNIGIYVHNTLFDPDKYTAETTEILTTPFIAQYCYFNIGKYGVEYTERNKVIEDNSNIELLRDFAGASTFDNADYCITPQGLWPSWTQKTSSLAGTMANTIYPNFRNMLQKRTSDNAYESCYLRLFEKGIDRDTLIFHKNADNFKLYHGVIGGTEIPATLGYEYSFSLIYTWGLLNNNFVDNSKYILTYNEFNGKRIYFVYFFDSYSGTIELPLKYMDYTLEIIEKDNDVHISNGMNAGGISVSAQANQRLVFKLNP